MIIGKGDIAKILENLDREDVTFFASGVSDSKETNEKEFKREEELLKKQPIHTHLVYISTLSLFYVKEQTPYLIHKKKMEALIKSIFKSYTIVRIGNINWGSNPNTLINYLKSCIKNNKPFAVQQTYRHIIDLDEFLYWMNLIRVGEMEEMNMPGKMVWVPDLVEQLIQNGQSIPIPSMNTDK